MSFSATFSSPFGPLTLICDQEHLLYLNLTNPFFAGSLDEDPTSPLLKEAIRQLKLYFEGKLFNFSLPLSPKGTPFYTKVWKKLHTIPYGETISYSEMATVVGVENGARAIGGALHNNPLPLLIPCHRIINKNQKLGGFAWGLDKKRWILDHEKKHILFAFHSSSEGRSINA